MKSVITGKIHSALDQVAIVAATVFFVTLFVSCFFNPAPDFFAGIIGVTFVYLIVYAFVNGNN